MGTLTHFSFLSARVSRCFLSPAALRGPTALQRRYRMKKLVSLLLILVLTLGAVSALAVEDDGYTFVIRNASREVPRIAITVDDCFDLPMTQQIFDLTQELGVRITFFPLGCQLHEEDADMWRAIAASDCEIGSHTFAHTRMGDLDARSIISSLGRSQQALDAVLGYHYEVRSVRPPFGNYTDANGSGNKTRNAVQKYGIKHLINWDVSQTDPNIAIHKVQNGSVLLYHARPADYRCLQQLIPELLDKGYELVTVTELFGFDPPTTSPDMYVFNSKDYYD